MGKHLVLIGGGHAHMMTLASLSRFTAKGHEVTVIGPSPYHYYSGMGPGMLAGMYRPEEIRFATRRVVERQGGDCIHFAPQPLDKVGVYAVRQNPVLCHNLLASLEGDRLRRFSPGGDYLLIYNLGDGTGILRKRGLIFSGRPAFWLKDYIDRRFMRRFQALE
ncbi:MAG: hypothetical protein ACYCX0_00985 [Desulfurivibrionaceae bacterium]|jgi:NADH dehydrogenase FAD-containing subunit